MGLSSSWDEERYKICLSTRFDLSFTFIFFKKNILLIVYFDLFNFSVIYIYVFIFKKWEKK